MCIELRDTFNDKIEVSCEGESVRIMFRQQSGRWAAMVLDDDGCKQFIHAIAKEAGLEEVAELTEQFTPPFDKGDIVSWYSQLRKKTQYFEVSHCEKVGDEVKVWLTDGDFLRADRVKLVCKAEDKVI